MKHVIAEETLEDMVRVCEYADCSFYENTNI
jgi:hypothetical protein